VGDVTFMGERDYSMRAWLNPEELATRNMTAQDVVKRLNEQNVQVAAGQVGQQPVPPGQNFQLTMSALGRLIEGRAVRQHRAEDRPRGPQHARRPGGAASRRGPAGTRRPAVRPNLHARYRASVALSIYQLPGSNALKTAKAVYAKMTELSDRFSEGLKYNIVYDTTPFISESILEVLKTLRDAVILVGIVVLVFLQNWRRDHYSAGGRAGGDHRHVRRNGRDGLQPQQPFTVRAGAGDRHRGRRRDRGRRERGALAAAGLPPKEAAIKAMEEVTGPVVAVGLVLCAVFVPCAFITGITGQFFRQFALTIAVSTVISAFNSLTLSPALAALLLKPHGAKRDVLSLLLTGCSAGSSVCSTGDSRNRRAFISASSAACCAPA